MADSKVTKSKKTTKLAETKQNAKLAKRSTADLLNDLRSSSQAQLNNALIEAKADLKKAQQMLKAGELPASHVIKQMKAKIARIHTVMAESKNNKDKEAK